MDKLKIFIVAHMVRGGGAETFLRGILPELVLGMSDCEFTILLAESRQDYYREVSGIRIITVDDDTLGSTKKRVLFDNYSLVGIVKGEGPDIVFSAAEIVAPSLKKLNVPIVVVYHATLQFYMKADMNNSALKLLYTRWMRDKVAKIADMIVCVSHYERAEVGMRYHNHRFENSAVVYHGVDHNRFYPKQKDELVKNRFPFRYILCISDFHTHKKMEEMIEIFHYMVENDVDEHLVLVGREKNKEASVKIKNNIEKYDLKDKVHIIDYIDNSDLRDIYLGCTFYWTHSRHESFGMTPLEAMACGIPVFAAWREALPEVYGDSVLFYNTFTEGVDEIAKKAVDFINNSDMLTEYSKKGYEYSLRYTWKRAADEYIRILYGLIGDR